jgi:hypothetical protein
MRVSIEGLCDKLVERDTGSREETECADKEDVVGCRDDPWPAEAECPYEDEGVKAGGESK